MDQITPEELKLYGNVEAVEENRIYKKFAHSPRHKKDYFRLLYFDFDQRAQVEDLLTEREVLLFERQRHHQEKRITGLMKIIAPRADHFFLDLGCEVGQLSFQLARAGARVVGLDIRYGALQLGSAILNEFSLPAPVSFICQNAISLPFRNEIFDRVVCADVIEHLSDEEKQVVLQEVYRVLKPSGEVFFHTPNNRRVQLGLFKRRLLALLQLENPMRIRHHYPEDGGHVGLTTPRKLIPMLTASGFDCISIYCPGDIPVLKGLSRLMNDLLSADTPGLRCFLAANFVLIGKKRIGR